MRDFLARIFGSTIRQSVKTFGDLSPAVNHHGNGDVNITFGESRDDAKLKHTEIQQELRLLPDAIEKRLISAIQQSGLLPQAAAEGLGERTIFALAARLNPEIAQDLDQAMRELQAAVDVAIDIRKHGLSPGSSEDALVAQVFTEIAQRNQEGRLDEGAAAVDAGLAQLEAQAIAQQAALCQKRKRLLEAGINQDLLRRDHEAVAKRIEALVAIDTSTRPAWTKAFRAHRDAFYCTGRDLGLILLSEVAIILSRRMYVEAITPLERCEALNMLGNALVSIGERTHTSTRLEEAVSLLREAKKEQVRTEYPFLWAATHNNLAIALKSLAARQSDRELLSEAVEAHREALGVISRQSTPLEWAIAQNNFGNSLRVLGKQDNDTARLLEALSAFHSALAEFTRERVPLDWAGTQNNLGNTLQNIGESETGTVRMEEAANAYRAALEERTRNKVRAYQ